MDSPADAIAASLQSLTLSTAESKHRSIKGTKEGIQSIIEWFGQFDDFSYNDNVQTFTNFERLGEQQQFVFGDRQSRKCLKTLLMVIKKGSGSFPRNSEAGELAQAIFDRRFPGVVFNKNETLGVNTTRVKEHERWREWEETCPDPEKSVRRAIYRRLLKDWGRRVDQLKEDRTRKVPTMSDVASALPTTDNQQLQGIDLVEIEQLLNEVAPSFFHKYKGFLYNRSQSLSSNFLRFAEFKHLETSTQFNAYLHPLLVRVVDAMTPKPIDRHFGKDYAMRFFAKFQRLDRVPGLTSHEEFQLLMEEQGWSSSTQKVGHQLQVLEQSVTGRLASDLVTCLRQIPSLAPLANAGKPNKPTVAYIPPHMLKKTTQSDLEGAKAARLQRYLDRYPHHTREPTESLMVEFERLAISQNWKKGTKTYKNERSKFLCDQFEDEWSDIMYTPDESDDDDEGGENGEDFGGVPINKALKLAQWQNLCHELGIEPVPQSIRQCKKALDKTYVNIIDLLEARHLMWETGDETVTVRRFQSESALAKYTRDTDKIFPKARAKQQGALRALLVHVFGHPGRRGRTA